MNITYKVFLSVLFIHSALSFSLHTATDPNLYLVKVTDPDALCLDGSPAAYYVSKDGDPKKIYLQFEGGGWCTGTDSINQTLDDCLSRTKTGQGSSNSMPLVINSMTEFFQQTVKITLKIGQEFYSNIVMVQGIKEPEKIPSLTKEQIFTLGVIMLQSVNQILCKGKTNFSHKQPTLLSAEIRLVALQFSYGQITSKKESKSEKYGRFLIVEYSSTQLILFQANHNTEICSKTQSVSPTFKSHHQFLSALRNLKIHCKIACLQQTLLHTSNLQCLSFNLCMIHGQLRTFLEFHVFIIVHWLIVIPKKMIIEKYHQNTTNAIIEMIYKNPNINGVWAPVCANHVYSTSGSYYSDPFRIPQRSQNSIVKAVQNWMEENKDITTYQLIDLGKWPDNYPCAGQITPWN